MKFKSKDANLCGFNRLSSDVGFVNSNSDIAAIIDDENPPDDSSSSDDETPGNSGNGKGKRN